MDTVHLMGTPLGEEPRVRLLNRDGPQTSDSTSDWNSKEQMTVFTTQLVLGLGRLLTMLMFELTSVELQVPFFRSRNLGVGRSGGGKF